MELITTLPTHYEYNQYGGVSQLLRINGCLVKVNFLANGSKSNNVMENIRRCLLAVGYSRN
mgnify:CR=1 FL=1